MPIGWTVTLSPPATTSPSSTPSRLVTAAATRNRMSPVWVNSVAIFVYLWRSPYR